MQLDVNAVLDPLVWALAVAAVVGLGLGVIGDVLFDAIDERDDGE